MKMWRDGMSNLTLGSLFSGSGGFELAGILCGITPIWASEIEAFPIRVTSKRLPQVTHLGDIHTIHGGDITPVDIITFGSPCTNLSIAGKREGLKGEQSSLFYEAIRIIEEMREVTNGKYPRYAIWENVMGAFSSNQGEDFRAVLESFGRIKDKTLSIPRPKKWRGAGSIVGRNFSIAYRSLDARYFGVPQRRKRIFLVADFDGTSAEKILFESKSLPWDIAQGEGSWQDAPTSATKSTRDTSKGVKVFENHGQDTRYEEVNEVAPTVAATYGTGGNNQPFVVSAFDIRQTSEGTKNQRNNVYETDTSRTLDTSGNLPSSNQGGVAVIQGSMIGRKEENGPRGAGISEEVSYTLNTTDKHAVVYALDRESFNCGSGFARTPGISEDGIHSTLQAQGPGAVGVPIYSSSKASFFMKAEEELANTLVATDYKDPPIVNVKTASQKEVFGTLSANVGEKQWLGNQEAFSGDYHVVEPEYIIRRLTPTECARLQGFPEDWCLDLESLNPSEEEIAFFREVFETHRKIVGKSGKAKTDKQLIKWLQNPYSDSAEYKMWGNGVALPCVVYVLASLVYYEKEEVICEK